MDGGARTEIPARGEVTLFGGLSSLSDRPLSREGLSGKDWGAAPIVICNLRLQG